MDERILVAVCCMLFFIILFLMGAGSNCDLTSMIPGFWKVSNQFKEKANIDQMIIYFDKGNGYNYTGYLIIVADGVTMYNGSMRFKITPKGYFGGNDYTFIMEKSIDIIPQNTTMVINPIDGSMEIKCLKTKKLYAHLFKDNQGSSLIIMQEKQNSSYTKNTSHEESNQLEIQDTEDVRNKQKEQIESGTSSDDNGDDMDEL